MHNFHKTINHVHNFLVRNYFHVIIFTLVIMGLTSFFLIHGQIGNSAIKQVTHPNIIFILTDDQTASDLAYMPKVNSLLAAPGMTFNKYYFNIAQCCPSRAATFKGEYSHNTQITGNDVPAGGFTKFHSLGEESSTLATWLKGVGYKTVLFGKYLNHYPDGAAANFVPPGWSEWYGAVGAPYGEYNYQLVENGVIKSYGKTDATYLTDVIANKAADFINRNYQSPMFEYVAPLCPHGPATPPTRYQNSFKTSTPPQPPSYNEADVSDKPTWIKSLPTLNTTQTQDMKGLYKDRLRCLQAVDDLVQKIYNTLSTKGVVNNTYIFFASDNGFHMGQHRLDSGKDTAYEEDINFPLIVRGPSVPHLTDSTHLVGNIDLAPTFAELAGAQADANVDGRSFASILSGGSPNWRNSYLLEKGEPQDQGDKPPGKTAYYPPPYRGLRTLDYLYVEYDNGEREFYNVTADPYELNNVYSTTDPILLSSLSSILNLLKTCIGPMCRTYDGLPLIPPTPTPTPTLTPTPTPTDTPTPTPTETPTPTDEPTPTPTDEPTPTPQ